MPEDRDDLEVTVETHSLLLSLAGLVDDELLGWCRELVAVGEGDYAIELVTGAVQADRVRLPVAQHEQLLAAASRRQLLSRSESLPPPDPSPRMRHRFLADPTLAGFPAPGPENSPEEALREVPARLLRGCQLRLTWRITPAGSAPGPLPHPVVLVETADTAGADVLAYQVGEVLSRAGVFASVEVFAADAELGDYHRAALAEARHIDFLAEPAGSSGGSPLRPESPRGEAGPRGRDGVRRPVDHDQRRSGPGGENARPGRAPLRPVDRVITARGSAPPRPRSERAGRDDLATGLAFDQPSRGGDGHANGGKLSEVSDGLEIEPPVELPRIDRRVSEPPAEPVWSPSGELPAQPSAEGGAGLSGAPSFSAVGESDGSDRAMPPARPAGRSSAPPDDLPEPPPGLSEVEQRLLRQLHEELAAREDGEAGANQDLPQARMLRNTNGGRMRPPRPLGGPDRAS